MEEPGPRELAVYLVGITGLSVASIAIFYGVFTAGYPALVGRLFEEPGAAARDDPGTIIVTLAGVALVILLVALVVAFGAKYGPHPEDRRRPKR